MATKDAKNTKRLKTFDRLAFLTTIVVLALVVFTRGEQKPDFGIDFSFLPAVYSSFNAITAVVLLFALLAIKQKKIVLHQRLIYIAFATSLVFLLMYVVYHFTTPETKYCIDIPWKRTIYFFLLITHIILAGLILPFILLTFNRAYLGFIDRHRKMAKWVFPFWFYVAVTGPIIYLMLYPCYNH